ncbi:MAG TPA: energy transducer TonB [Pseudomonadales bacterium]
MTGLAAGLRFPLAFAMGLLLTASLFTMLWVFTNKTFDVTETTQVRIAFTRVERDIPPVNRRQQKVAKPPPAVVPDVPSIGRGTATGIDTSVVMPTEPGIALDTGINVSGADRDAVPLVRINPTYPPRAAANGDEGWVRVQFDITASGSVTNVMAVESEPGTVFDAAAVEAVARWRYNPSIVNGEAVDRVGMQTLLRFTLED